MTESYADRITVGAVLIYIVVGCFTMGHIYKAHVDECREYNKDICLRFAAGPDIFAQGVLWPLYWTTRLGMLVVPS